jgi:hypothetical protein
MYLQYLHLCKRRNVGIHCLSLCRKKRSSPTPFTKISIWSWLQRQKLVRPFTCIFNHHYSHLFSKTLYVPDPQINHFTSSVLHGFETDVPYSENKIMCSAKQLLGSQSKNSFSCNLQFWYCNNETLKLSDCKLTQSSICVFRTYSIITTFNINPCSTQLSLCIMFSEQNTAGMFLHACYTSNHVFYLNL